MQLETDAFQDFIIELRIISEFPLFKQNPRKYNAIIYILVSMAWFEHLISWHLSQFQCLEDLT